MSILEIQYTKFKNFFSFGSKETLFEIKPGIHLITGFNKMNNSRNGCGKTSLINSILFGLFGKVDKELSQIQIINWKNRKNCECEIGFKKDNESYIIKRGLKPNILELYHNDKLIPQPSNKVAFQEEIEKDILGFDFNSFMSLIHCNPNNTISIFKSSKPTKRKLLEQLFNLEEFTKFNDKLRERGIELNNEVSSINSTINSNEKSIENIRIFIEELNEFFLKGNEYEKSLNNIKNELLNFNIIEIEKDKIYQEKIIERIKEKKIVLQNILDSLNKRYILKNQEYKFLENKIQDEEVFDEEKYNEVKEKIEKLSNKNIEELKDSTNKQMEKLKNTKNSINNKIVQLKEKISSFNTEKSIITKQINLLKKHKICPTCKQEINENCYNDDEQKVLLLIKKKEKLEKITENLNIILTDTTFRINELIKIQNELILNEKNLKIYKYELDRLEKIKTEQEKNKKNKKELLKISKILKILKNKSAQYSDEITSKNNSLLLLENELSIMIKRKAEYENLIKEKENIENSIKEYNKRKKEVDEKINKHKNNISQLQNEIKTKKKEKSENEKMKEYIEFTRNLCKDENIKQYAISSYVPFLNNKLNSYLNEIGQPFYLKLNNWLDLEIKGPGISENSSFNNLSGGESKLVDQAMQMSFLDIAKIQSSIFPNILCLDELLDSSVDEVNLLKILNMIQYKQKQDNLCVYIVSHRNEINNFNVDSIINVIKENSYSKLEV